MHADDALGRFERRHERLHRRLHVLGRGRDRHRGDAALGAHGLHLDALLDQRVRLQVALGHQTGDFGIGPEDDTLTEE